MRISALVSVSVLATPVALGAIALGASPASAQSTCHGETATIVGTSGDDDETGTILRDVVVLGAGNDSFNGGGGDDLVCGGKGNDQIRGGDGNDVLDGGGGKDRLSGGAGGDLVWGRTGADYVAEGPGDDQIAGGKSTDTVSYQSYDDNPVTVDGSQATVDGAGHDEYGQVEIVRGTKLADTMIGGSGVDGFDGGGGDDDLSGFGGNDVLRIDGGQARGGEGNDVVTVLGGVGLGGAGTDRVSVGGSGVGKGNGGDDQFTLRAGHGSALGGAGNDVFAVVSRDAASDVEGGRDTNVLTFKRHKRAVRVDVGDGKASWKGGSMTFGGIQVVVGTRKADTLVGSGRADWFDAGSGDDRMTGLGGNDFLIGRRGFDRGNGGSGGDNCITEVELACEV